MKSSKMGFRKKKKRLCPWVREGKPDCEPRGVAGVQRVDVDGHRDLPGVTRLPPRGRQELPSMQGASPETGRMCSDPVCFPGGASGKKPTCQYRRCKRRSFNPWVGKIPWRRKWQPTPILLPGESQGQRSLVLHGQTLLKRLSTAPCVEQCVIGELLI